MGPTLHQHAPTRGEKDEAQVRTKVRITLLVTEDTFARLNRNTTSGDIVIDQKDGPTYFLPIEKVEYIREKR